MNSPSTSMCTTVSNRPAELKPITASLLLVSTRVLQHKEGVIEDGRGFFEGDAVPALIDRLTPDVLDDGRVTAGILDGKVNRRLVPASLRGHDLDALEQFQRVGDTLGVVECQRASKVDQQPASNIDQGFSGFGSDFFLIGCKIRCCRLRASSSQACRQQPKAAKLTSLVMGGHEL